MMSGREPENRTRVETAAQITAHRHVRPEPYAHGFVKLVPQLSGVLRIRMPWSRSSGRRVVEIPVLIQLEMFVGREQIMPGWDLQNAIKERAHLVAAEFDRLIDGPGVPARGYTGREQGLHLRREIQRVTMAGVEKRLDAEAIARGEERPVPCIPEGEGELATQVVQALRTEVFIEMECDLAV